LKVIVIAALIAFACAATWDVENGYGAGTPIPGTPVQWAVLRFFPGNLTINAGDTVAFTHMNDAHTITFAPAVIPIFKDNDNLFFSETIFPIPLSTGSQASPTIIANTTQTYSSGLLFIPGSKWYATFPNAGSFFYFCVLHPDMTGTITVLAAGAPLPNNATQIASDIAAEKAIVDTTAATYASRIRNTPIREVRTDGTALVTIDNGYGEKTTRFSLNIFGPSHFGARVGDTVSFVLRDFASGHTIALNGSNEFYWDDFVVLVNGTISGSKLYYRSFGDNTNWAGSFVSGGILLPPIPGVPGSQTWNLTIGADIVNRYTLPRNFTFLCNIHTLNPGNATGAARVYLGMSGQITVYPACANNDAKCKACDPQDTVCLNGTKNPSSAATILFSIACILAALILFFTN
jgi:plastocyanin